MVVEERAVFRFSIILTQHPVTERFHPDRPSLVANQHLYLGGLSVRTPFRREKVSTVIAQHTTSNTVRPFSYKSRTISIHCWTSASQPLDRYASSSSGNALSTRQTESIPSRSVRQNYRPWSLRLSMNFRIHGKPWIECETVRSVRSTVMTSRHAAGQDRPG